MSMMVSFVLSFFPRDVLDEILNLIESVSEDFPSYSCLFIGCVAIVINTPVPRCENNVYSTSCPNNAISKLTPVKGQLRSVIDI